MSKSQRLRFADTRRVQSLVHELGDGGSEPHAWRLAALQGLQNLVGGQVAFTIDCDNAFPQNAPHLVEPIDIGWDTDSSRQRFLQYMTSGESGGDPGTIALMESHVTTRFVTRYRRQMVNDAEWYASPTVSEARRSGNVDDYLHTSVRLRPGVIQGFILYRAWGDTPFAERERKLLRLFHAHLLQRISAGIHPSQMLNAPPMLAPRLRQTFELLLEGRSMKEIAQRLGISRHTVNDYLKVLYRRFNVHTRAQLLARHHRLSRQKALILPRELFVNPLQ